MATVQSIIDRVTYITGDSDRVRWSLREIVTWMNEAAGLLAEMPGGRVSAQYVTLTLAEGSRQSLAVIDPTKRWVRLFEIVCNAPSGKPTGATVRQISRPALDVVSSKWRSQAPTARAVTEYALDERSALQFDVIPPVQAGVQVYALAAVKPAAFGVLDGTGSALANVDEEYPLADGMDVPTVDFVLYRCFMKDTNAPSSMARATAHLQAFQAAAGVEARDAAPQ